MSLTILIAEDDEKSRYLLEHLLVNAGHRVITAADGQEALLRARAGRPDVIVSDALMPRADGFQFCLAIRQDAELCGVPFIFFTATYTEDADAEFSRRVGGDRFLLKPDDADKLLPTIEEVVAAARNRPAPQPAPLASDLLEEYTRRLSFRLEAKVAELQRTTQELSDSETAVRALNTRLEATVAQLEREVAERRATEELLRLAQTVGGLGAWGRDLVTGDAWWSDEALRAFGLPVGTPRTGRDQLVALTHPDDRMRFDALLTSAGRDHLPFDTEVRVVRPDGETRHVHIRSEIFRDAAGTPLRRVGTIQDITTRKRAEAERSALESRLVQAQKMEALGNLAGGVAHDFNNLLTIIVSNAELLELEIRPVPQLAGSGENVRSILTAATRARDLVRQILTFSRRQPVERRPVELGRVTTEAVRLLRTSLPKSVEFHLQLAAPHRTISANETQLHQIILNLCHNALHALADQAGAITLRLDVTEADPTFAAVHPPLRPGECVVLSVRDTGCGIAPEHLPHLFEPFFTTKPAGQGTGLGLAVVYGIVQAHEGAITVESQRGRGTTFTVWLPVLRPTTTVEPAAIAPAGGAIHTGARILFVDDEPSVAKISVRLLQQLGYRAEAMTDPVAARDRLTTQPDAFDLVITDYLMPRLTGLDLAQAVWKVRPDLPMLLAAGFGGQINLQRAQAAGFRDLIAKPFTLRVLSEACTSALAARAPV